MGETSYTDTVDQYSEHIYEKMASGKLDEEKHGRLQSKLSEWLLKKECR